MNLSERARLSGGTSHDAIHRAVARLLASAGAAGRVVDVGCGGGELLPFVRDRFATYIGIDSERYERFPASATLVRADLERSLPLADGSADAVAAVEIIEHLENAWGFVREIARITRPGGWVVLSTPNQLSALSVITLLMKQRFASFQDIHYPAHRTALLPVDLERMAAAAGLEEVRTHYTLAGRVPLSARHYPLPIARLSPRLLSDTVVLVARRSARP